MVFFTKSPPRISVSLKCTNGQPFLLQAYGSSLIRHLNDTKRKQAELADIGIIEEQVLEEWNSGYFRNIITQNVPEYVTRVFRAWKNNETPELDRLTHRCLLTS